MRILKCNQEVINTGKILRPGGGESVDLDIITAVAADVKAGKVIVDKDGNPISGTMAAVAGRTVTPGKANQTVISAGKWASGNIIVAGDSDLVAANIARGKNIFGVNGSAKVIKTKKLTVNSGSRATFQYYNVQGTLTSRSMYTVTVTGIGFTPAMLTLYPVNQYQEYNATMWADFKDQPGSVVVIGALDDWTQFYSPTEISADRIYVPVDSQGQYHCWILGY